VFLLSAYDERQAKKRKEIESRPLFQTSKRMKTDNTSPDNKRLSVLRSNLKAAKTGSPFDKLKANTLVAGAPISKEVLGIKKKTISKTTFEGIIKRKDNESSNHEAMENDKLEDIANESIDDSESATRNEVVIGDDFSLSDKRINTTCTEQHDNHKFDSADSNICMDKSSNNVEQRCNDGNIIETDNLCSDMKTSNSVLASVIKETAENTEQTVIERLTDNNVTVTDNIETVTDNIGTVTDNNVTVTDNNVTVTDNIVTVTDNIVTVPDNIVTVPDNIVTVPDNIVTVPDNIVTVTDNIVTVTDNIGTVTDNIVTADITNKSAECKLKDERRIPSTDTVVKVCSLVSAYSDSDSESAASN